MEPLYISAHKNRTLAARIVQALEALRCCELCPRCCRVDRIAGETGVCRTGRNALVASFAPHFGEEAPLVGRFGSGTIFFSNCNLNCTFCQNSEISRGGEGSATTASQLAGMMIELQNQGVHNINFVSPSHVVPQILEALPEAIDSGLNIPLVYNSGGYDRVETLRLLDGIIDIYMPDIKFSSDIPALFYCAAPDYPLVSRAAVREMHRQVGDLRLDSRGRAVRGLLVRHLVMPDGLAGTQAVMRFLAEEISPATYVNIMDQYRPCGDVKDFKELQRRITPEEYEEALAAARAAGLSRLDSRERPILLHWR
ncbi:MAG: radical SAM protein [Deltaproteobacteria bacterium]|nr:radical SAM protein [Deltaproteobacteria bacterium]